jgi:hypothetical protein
MPFGMCVARPVVGRQVLVAATPSHAMRRQQFTRWTVAAAMIGAVAIVVVRPMRVEAIGFCSHAISAASHRTPQARHQIVHTRQYDPGRMPDAAPRGAALLPHERRNDAGGTRSKHSSRGAVDRMPVIAARAQPFRATVLEVGLLDLPAAVFHDAHAPPCLPTSSAGALS